MENLKLKIPTVEEMLEAGIHFGHPVKRWDPRMKRYIYATDKKTHIIDVFQTRKMLEKACEFLYEMAKSGKQIVMVGTKRQASDLVEVKAKECGALFVNQRWLGGTFTNYNSIRNNWKELNKLIEKREKGEFSHYTKKERLLIDRKINKLELFVGGIRDMQRFPGTIIVIDVKKEKTAVKEANTVNVPVVGIVDTNSDPSNIDFVIPANDDAIKSVDLILTALAEAIKAGVSGLTKEKGVKVEGKISAVKKVKKESKLEKKPVRKPAAKRKKTKRSKVKKEIKK